MTWACMPSLSAEYHSPSLELYSDFSEALQQHGKHVNPQADIVAGYSGRTQAVEKFMQKQHFLLRKPHVVVKVFVNKASIFDLVDMVVLSGNASASSAKYCLNQIPYSA
eukprot:357845-Chlamydomonas_euryale.AAC.8